MKTCFQLLLKKIGRCSSGEQGMTLVETLVALAILGVSVTAFILALSTGTIATRTQGEEAMVQGLARAQMETVKAAAYDSTGASYSAISTPADYSLTISTNSTLYSNTKIQKVTVVILHNGSQVYTLEGYKVNR